MSLRSETYEWFKEDVHQFGDRSMELLIFLFGEYKEASLQTDMEFFQTIFRLDKEIGPELLERIRLRFYKEYGMEKGIELANSLYTRTIHLLFRYGDIETPVLETLEIFDNVSLPLKRMEFSSIGKTTDWLEFINSNNAEPLAGHEDISTYFMTFYEETLHKIEIGISERNFELLTDLFMDIAQVSSYSKLGNLIQNYIKSSYREPFYLNSEVVFSFLMDMRNIIESSLSESGLYGLQRNLSLYGFGRIFKTVSLMPEDIRKSIIGDGADTILKEGYKQVGVEEVFGDYFIEDLEV